MREIWVAGYVHNNGGAGPELAHQIDLWRLHGVEVNLVVPNSSDEVLFPDNPRRQWCDARGCKTHLYTPEIFRDKVVLSFCETWFLDRLEEIHEKGRPRKVLWFNCMNFNHSNEEQRHKDGLIDIFGFQSKYQQAKLTPNLEVAGGPIKPLTGYVPYFSLDPATAMHTPGFKLRGGEEGPLTIARISRDDPAKYPKRFWEIMHRIATPGAKKVFSVGYGKEAMKKSGTPSTDYFARQLDKTVWAPINDSRIVMSKFWPAVHILCHYWDTFEENYPRALLEARSVHCRRRV